MIDGCYENTTLHSTSTTDVVEFVWLNHLEKYTSGYKQQDFFFFMVYIEYINIQMKEDKPMILHCKLVFQACIQTIGRHNSFLLLWDQTSLEKILSLIVSHVVWGWPIEPKWKPNNLVWLNVNKLVPFSFFLSILGFLSLSYLFLSMWKTYRITSSYLIIGRNKSYFS